jgi:hypothetical protein
MRPLLGLLVLLLFPSLSSAADIYVAQNAAGSDTGADCTNAHAVTFFNTVGNWGSGAGKIGPGTTVHLCGIITTPITVQGSGTAGNPITVLWETGAKFSKPSWGGGAVITMNGKSYIVLDGGTNGIIEDTNNGSTKDGFANQHNDLAISCAAGCPNAEIKNLTIRNIYQTTYSLLNADSSRYGQAILMQNAANSNISIHHNTFTNTGFAGVNFQLSGNESTNTIYSNTFSLIAWPIVYGTTTPGAQPSGIKIHDNDITNGFNWGGFWSPPPTASYNHLDPIHFWSAQANTSITGIQVYNNYIHGDFGIVNTTGNTTAPIYYESFANNVQHQTYNNLIVFENGSAPTNGAIVMAGKGGAMDSSVFNNTIDCGTYAGSAAALQFTGNNHKNVRIQNNIIKNCGTPIWVYNPATFSAIAINNNDYFGAYITQNGFRWGTSFASALPNWRTLCSCDVNSLSSNPNLDASYRPTAGSPVIGAATNLTSLGIIALNADKAKMLRAPSGAWDVGSYAFAPGRPNPPKNLRLQ